ncbi:MAG TPA: CdaR family protein [Enterococcus sp.]|nr:CdaR family protein [Enterococcus sp.]
MFTKQRKSNIMYGLLALLFSLVLFFNANGSSLQSSLITPSAYEETVTDVPIQTIYDSDKYFIQGYQPTVDVKLSSVNRVQLNAEKNDDTRNFRVVADLTGLDVGTHDVLLEIQDMSNSVTGKIESRIFTVTIEKKVTKKFPVEINYSQENLQDGFQLDKIVSEPSEVTVTTGEQTLKDIAKIVADVDALEDATNNQTIQATVYAVDKNGEILQTEINPQTVDVSLQVSVPEKSVSLYAAQKGTPPTGISHFDFLVNPTQAIISGSQELLDTIESIGVPVDVSDVKKTTKKVVTIPTKEGVVATPKQVTVEISPVFTEESSSTNSSSVTAETEESQEETTEVEQSVPQTSDESVPSTEAIISSNEPEMTSKFSEETIEKSTRESSSVIEVQETMGEEQ